MAGQTIWLHHFRDGEFTDRFKKIKWKKGSKHELPKKEAEILLKEYYYRFRKISAQQKKQVNQQGN